MRVAIAVAIVVIGALVIANNTGALRYAVGWLVAE